MKFSLYRSNIKAIYVYVFNNLVYKIHNFHHIFVDSDRFVLIYFKKLHFYIFTAEKIVLTLINLELIFFRIILACLYESQDLLGLLVFKRPQPYRANNNLIVMV